jgi:hypothetical protein
MRLSLPLTKKMGRPSNAREQLKEAAAIIERFAGGLLNKNLRDGFLGVEQIHEIMNKAER